MDKINGAGHVGREFVAEDAGTSRPPTEITAEWLNAVQRELVAVVEGAGLALSSLDSTQLNQAVRKIVQLAAPITAVAGGTVDAITAGFVPVVTTDVAGRIPTVTVMIIATGANTGAGLTIDAGTGAFGVVKGAGAALVAGDVHGAGHVLHVRGVRGANAAADKWVLLNPATGVTPQPGTVGAVRNARMSVAAASATATFTADEVIVESVLGGATYKVANVNKLVNLAITGSGGMDTGAAPASGYVALYLFYNPQTGASEIKAVNATAAVMPMIYGGANASVGFTASALISVWATNSASQFVVGHQTDRYVGISPILNVLTTSAVQASATSLSIAAAVPKNATTVSGHLNINSSVTSTQTLYIGGDANMSGATFVADTGLGVGAPFSGIQLATPQTVYYKSTNSAGSPNFYIYISGYTI
jgi:hypothetical protein